MFSWSLDVLHMRQSLSEVDKKLTIALIVYVICIFIAANYYWSVSVDKLQSNPQYQRYFKQIKTPLMDLRLEQVDLPLYN